MPLFPSVLVIAVIAMILQGIFILEEKKKNYILAVIFKGSASLCFALIGVLALLEDTTDVFVQRIVSGLILGMIGDIIMNLRFIFKKHPRRMFLLGIFVFLIGHVMYLLALIPISHHLAESFAVGIILALGLVIYIFKTMDVKPVVEVFGAVYLCVVIAMTTIAFDIAVFSCNTATVVFATGALLFTASDIGLVFNSFRHKSSFRFRIVNLSLYILGQILIAASLIF